MLYFDSAAAWRPPSEVLDFHRAALEEEFANQEAAHSLGYEARKRLETAERELAEALTSSPGWRVIWGNSGTSLFRLLADSPLVAGKRVLSSKLEHPALTAQFRRTANEISFLAVEAQSGKFRLPDSGKAHPAFDTLALHQIQSELGVVQALDELLTFFRARARRPFFAVADAIQAAGKYELPRNADAIVVSGHKFGAPGGAALLLAPDSAFTPILLKFAERYRHTDYGCARPEPALMRTLSFAARLRSKTLQSDREHVAKLQHLLRELLTGIPLPGGGKIRPTVPEAYVSSYILHLLLPGIDTGVLVRMLSGRGIMVAAGSACTAESPQPSATLAALGIPRRDGHSGLRISLAPENTPAEVKKLAATIVDVLKNY